jgi:ribonucleotide reductase alpha subunit
MYKDSVNKKSMQKNIGIIRSSNLCVTGDTLLLTKDGNIEIEKLVNKEIEIWNGFEWSTVIPKKTGIDKEILFITFSNNKFVKCTHYHKFPIIKNNQQHHSFIDAKDLSIGDKLLNHYMPDNKELTEDVYIKSITTLPHLYDTYCFTETKRNLGIFNGVLLGNCSEIVEYTDNDTIANCNLLSIALPKFVYYENEIPKYDFEKLKDICKTVTRNLDNVIEINFYPVKEAKLNNFEYRPLGIGVQGLADVFAMFKYTWGSDEAKILNKQIFETIYYGCVEASTDLAIERGSYTKFEGSPWSYGLLQYDLWNEKPITDYDWTGLKEKVKRGMRNSLLTTVMPVAGTSQILGNNEACEPFTSNMYSRSTLAGDFIMMNKYLVKDLKELGLWNKEIINNIIENEGSIQNIKEIPQTIKDIYRTVWEISQKILIDYYRDRAPFIDQAQSLNLFLDHPTIAKLSSMHMYSWKNDCKNGIYYCRSKPSRSAVKFNLLTENKKEGKTYMKDGKEYKCFEDVCIACSG